MDQVKFYGMIPVTIYNDDHEVHHHEDYSKIICPLKDEIFVVSSNKGSLDLCCPGCGQELKRVVDK